MHGFPESSSAAPVFRIPVAGPTKTGIIPEGAAALASVSTGSEELCISC
jgi:hypothetical protein